MRKGFCLNTCLKALPPCKNPHCKFHYVRPKELDDPVACFNMKISMPLYDFRSFLMSNYGEADDEEMLRFYSTVQKVSYLTLKARDDGSFAEGIRQYGYQNGVVFVLSYLKLVVDMLCEYIDITNSLNGLKEC